MMKSDKPKEVENLKELFDSYPVVGILNMHKLPARQLQVIREKLKGKAVVRMSKKSLLKKAMEASEKDIKELENYMAEEPAVILSNDNPFRLFRILKENRISAPAKKGDTVKSDIVVQKGSTGIPPGPAMSTLQKIGLKTTVDKGKIAVATEKRVLKAGEKVTDDMVNAFNLLKMEPMEIGLDLVAVWEKGTIYSRDVLDIDTDAYIAGIENALSEMTNLSLNTGYIVGSTVSAAIQKAFAEARTLAMEANMFDSNIIDEILRKAVSEAKALEKAVQ